MIPASCHCGAVRMEIEAAPAEVSDCSCSICRRLGTLWAYYVPRQVTITGATDTYSWGAKQLAFHRCKVCGNATHWSSLHGLDRMGVNARLMEPDVLARATLRKIGPGRS